MSIWQKRAGLSNIYVVTLEGGVEQPDLKPLAGLLVEQVVVGHHLVPPGLVVEAPLVLPGTLIQHHGLKLLAGSN